MRKLKRYFAALNLKCAWSGFPEEEENNGYEERLLPRVSTRDGWLESVAYGTQRPMQDHR
eukprot:scaffold86_cov338-Pavlova_lutheri.AAC.6